MSAVKIKDQTRREAVRILMLSPFYFKMALTDRKILIQEFCALHGTDFSS
jgi:hypothetical protein